MAKATQLPSGNWRVRAKAAVDGEIVLRSFTAPTASKAEAMAEEWQEHCKRVGEDSTTMTVQEAIGKYISIRSALLSPSTIREYNRILDNDMTDLMDLPLYKLTCPIIQRSINAAAVTLSAKTVKNRYSLLQHTLATYYPEFVWAIKYPKRVKKPKRTYSHEYIRQILDAVKGTDFEVETYLGMLSMRESEICGLMWEDIDYSNKALQIQRTKLMNGEGEYVIVDGTKTADSRRTIYIPKYVCGLLQERQKETESPYVSTVNPNRFWAHLNRILKKHNVEQLAFHELRHIYSSLTASLAIDKQIRMENGGWSNEHIMEGTYQHSMSEAQKDANKKLDRYFRGKGDTKSDTENRQPAKFKRFRRVL